MVYNGQCLPWRRPLDYHAKLHRTASGDLQPYNGITDLDAVVTLGAPMTEDSKERFIGQEFGEVERVCSVCADKGLQRRALFIATGSNSLQWFECVLHGARDNHWRVERITRVLIEDWLHGSGITER